MRMKEQGRQDMAYQLHCMVRQQSNSDSCSEVPANGCLKCVIVCWWSSDHCHTDNGLNELVTKCDSQT